MRFPSLSSRSIDRTRGAAAAVSPDDVHALKKVDEKNRLDFPLLSDEDHSVAAAYGTWGERSMYGKRFTGVIRSSFLIDEQGSIARTWYRVKPADTVPNVIEALED